MPNATWAFYVDWNADGDFGDTGEDISAYVLEAEWTIGRDYASLLVGKCTAGMATIQLNNNDGRFNSYKSDGPYYGNILPGRKFQITGTYSGTTYTMFIGYLDSIESQPVVGGGHRATLRATGIISKLTGAKTSIAMQTNLRTGTAVGLVLDDVGIAAGDRSIDAGATVLGRYWTDGSVSAMNALQDLEAAEFGLVRESKDGKIVFEDRNHRQLQTLSNTSQATFSDAVGATLGYNQIQPVDAMKQIANKVTASVTTYSVSDLAVLWTLSETGDNSPAIAHADTADYWAEYPGSLSDQNAVAVDAWTTPVATTDFTANTSPLGTGTDITSDIAVAVSKFSKSMKISLTNNNAATAYITFLQARGTGITKADPVSIQSEDATSQTTYGQRDFPIDTAWLPDTAMAQAYCDFIVSKYKDVHPILQMGFLASTSANTLTEALTRTLSDRITITATGASKLGINSDFWVENISHHLRPGEHICTYQCSAADVYTTCWILGTSVLGTSTILLDREF